MNDRQLPRQHREALRRVIRQGSALELQNLLNERPVPLEALAPCVVIHIVYYKRPECARLVIDAGADAQTTRSVMKSVMDRFWLFRVFPLAFRNTQDQNLEGELILLLDILMHCDPSYWTEEAETFTDGTTNGEYILQELRSEELQEGTSMHREREGMLALLEGRYWQEYGGLNPFLEATTAEEMFALLLDGAAHDERGQTDMTRLRSIHSMLRRNVMALLQQRIDEQKSLAVLDVAVANNKARGAVSALGGLEKAIFPIIANFLGVRGCPFFNARDALATFNELATGAFETEYDAGDW